MAKYYTKEILKIRVEKLGEAIGSPMEVIECSGKYAIQRKYGGETWPFNWAAYYHPLKELMIHVDGALAGIQSINPLLHLTPRNYE